MKPCWLLLLSTLAAPVFGGCGSTSLGKILGTKGSSDADVAPHPGVSDESCAPIQDRLVSRNSVYEWNAKRQDTIETEIRLMVCAPDGLQRIEDSKITPAEHWHVNFEDRPWDALASALIVISLAPRRALPYDIAMVSMHAGRVGPDALRKALSSTALPEDVKAAFQKQYEAARRTVEERAQRLKGREDAKILLDVPPKVAEERQAYFAKYAKDFEAFDDLARRVGEALRAKKADAALLEESVALRDRHAVTCAEDAAFTTYGCWGGPLILPLTVMIRDLAIATGDLLRADLEDSTLRQVEPRDSLARDIYARQTASTRSSVEFIWTPPKGLPGDPELRKTIGDRVVAVHARVERLAPSGDTTSIHFKPSRVTSATYECTRWGKEWRQNIWKEWNLQSVCLEQKLVKTDSRTDVIEAIVIPTSEARSIQPGDVVAARVAGPSRRGNVLKVSRRSSKKLQNDAPVVQLRFTVVPAEESQ